MGLRSNESKKPRAKKERYGHVKVREKLEEMFGKKCSYCESKIDHISYKQVEHFRPQSIYPLLAFSWDNLLLACERCNGEFKRALFPLEDGTYSSENQDNPWLLDGSDTPALLNPCEDNPSDHIDFTREIPIGKTVRGQYSISTYGLARHDLNEERRAKIKEIQFIIELYVKAKSDSKVATRDRAASLIRTYIDSNSAYSAFMRRQVELSSISGDFL